MPILALIDDYSGHSLHVDRIREYTDRRPMQPIDIYKAASHACAELAEAIASDEDVDGIIAAERRLVAVGGLAQSNANTLELGRRS